MNCKNFCASIVLLLSLMISCSKDEPDTSFEGTWLLRSREKRNCNDSETDSGNDSNFVFNTPCTDTPRFFCSYDKYVFDEGAYENNHSGALFGIPYSGSNSGIYSIEGNKLTLCRERGSGEQECISFEYTINGNAMSLAFDNSETGCIEIDYYIKQ